MGAQIAKPNVGNNNIAKSNSDLAMGSLKLAANAFLGDVRLGTSNAQSLGYKLTDQKLTDQEVQIIVKTSDNVSNGEIDNAISDIFSGNWSSVTKFATKEIISFLSGKTPDPQDQAVNEEWSKSYLYWEFNSLVQYSIYLKKTNAQSIGTTTAATQMTVLACVCRGLVAYEGIDPQVIIYELSKSQPDLTEEQFDALISDVKKELEISAQLSVLKRQLAAGIGGVREGAASFSKGEHTLETVEETHSFPVTTWPGAIGRRRGYFVTLPSAMKIFATIYRHRGMIFGILFSYLLVHIIFLF